MYILTVFIVIHVSGPLWKPAFADQGVPPHDVEIINEMNCKTIPFFNMRERAIQNL